MQKKELEKQIDYLFRIALHKCGNLDDAKDLTQETLLSALGYLAGGQEIENLRAWLTSVLNRKFYDLLRAKYKLPTVSYEIAIETNDKDYEDEMIVTEDAEMVRRETAFLSKLYREVVVRHYMNGDSVQKIAKDLNVPVGTVKSRLSCGRMQIRKGFDIMESYTKQSYEPLQLYIACSGRMGLNDEPFSIVNDDLLVQNILVLAYHEPITETDISKAIGVPTAYIEPVIRKLIDNELMKRTGNKVYTDFIIFTPEDTVKFIPAQKKLVSENVELFYHPIGAGIKKLRSNDWYNNLSLRQKRKLELYFAVSCLDYGVFITGEKIYGGSQVFPNRPNGGKWIAFGTIQSKVIEDSERESFSYAGERWSSFDHYLNSKNICLHVYDTPIEKKRYSDLKYNMDDADVTQLLYIISENINPNEAGFNPMFLENIPHLAECGVLSSEEGKVTVDIPILTSDMYQTICDIRNEAISKFTENTMNVMAEHFKNAKTEIPKHLKSVPLQKQYMNSMGCIVMMTLYYAYKQGLTPTDIDFPCPPMILVVDK